MPQFPLSYKTAPRRVLFSASLILLAIEIATFGAMLSVLRVTAEQAEVATDMAWLQTRMEMRDLIAFGCMGTLGGIALLIFGFWLVRRLKKAAIPLVIDSESVTVPGVGEISYSAVQTVLFIASEAPAPALFEGICAPERDTPNTSIEIVLLLPEALDDYQLLAAEDNLRPRISGFHLLENSESAAIALVEALKAANPNARIITRISKFEKQRVIWRMKPKD